MNITVEGVSYYFEVDGEGEPLLLLHGFTGDHSTWGPLQLEQTFQVITIDIIGHGKTDSPNDASKYEMEHMSRAIIAILDSLNIEKTHILGYSMGGRLALSFSMYFQKRVKSLILESTSPGIRNISDRDARILQDERMAEMILKKGILEFVNYWEKIPLFQTQHKLASKVRKQIRSQRLANNQVGLVNSLRGMGTGKQPSWWNALSSLKVPVLLLCGELDTKFCNIAKEMEIVLPNVELVEFRAVGHAIHVEDPVKFGTIVKNYVEMRRDL